MKRSFLPERSPKAGVLPQRLWTISVVLFFLFSLSACSEKKHDAETDLVTKPQKTGVLLVSHGSPSKTWRRALFDLEKKVAPEIMKNRKISGVKTAFMEYNEPSIATCLKEFDKEGYTDLIVIPVFLTVSPHSFDDLPTIMGQKEDPQSLETLRLEKIERYKPKATLHVTPLLDFGDMLQKNVLRRVQALSRNPAEEGLVLIGYGDEVYEKEWKILFERVGESVKANTGIDTYTYAWCGHIARYRSEPTTEAVKTVLEKKRRALVIPVLVAFDENFQIRIIGNGVSNIPDEKERVSYKPDALLPDRDIEQWVVETSLNTANAIATPKQ